MLLPGQAATDGVYVQWTAGCHILLQIPVDVVAGAQHVLVSGTSNSLIKLQLLLLLLLLHCTANFEQTAQTLKEPPRGIRCRLQADLAGGSDQWATPRGPRCDEVTAREEASVVAGGLLRHVAIATLEQRPIDHVDVINGGVRGMVVAQLGPLLCEATLAIDVAVLGQIGRAVDGVAVGAAVRWPDPVKNGDKYCG